MALKDWRLIKEDDDWIQWWHDTKRIGVFVFYQDYVDYVKKKSHWVFTATTDAGHKTLKEVNTKTKSQALSFAKQYMRRN